jgi:hypothetical protein
MTDDPRSRNGHVSDRRATAPHPAVVALFIALMIIGGVAAFSVSRSTEHASTAAEKATAALGAARAATDRLHAAAYGSCRRLQMERERINSDNATIWLVLRQARETSPPKGRPALQRLARSTTYGPPANCQAAVDKPASYRAPKPIPYTRLPIRFADAVVRAAILNEPQPLPRGVVR